MKLKRLKSLAVDGAIHQPNARLRVILSLRSSSPRPIQLILERLDCLTLREALRNLRNKPWLDPTSASMLVMVPEHLGRYKDRHRRDVEQRYESHAR